VTLKLELVGATSPVASGQVITIKATLTAENMPVSNLASRPVTFVPSSSAVGLTCPPLLDNLLTDGTGAVSINCTVGALTMPANTQGAPLLASLTFIANALALGLTPSSATASLQVPVLGNLCGGVTGTGGSTKLFEGFNPATPGNLAGTVSATISALAFEGEVVQALHQTKSQCKICCGK
jgi:hypothetical protein